MEKEDVIRVVVEKEDEIREATFAPPALQVGRWVDILS